VLAGQRRFVFLLLTLLLLGASDLGGRLLFSLTTGYVRQQAGELQEHMKISCGIFAAFLFWANRSNPS
jgi:hypothetical protein